MGIKKIVWDKAVLDELKDISAFLKTKEKDATKIIPEILNLVKNFKFNSEIYSIDKFKTDNDGSFRAFEKFHYRVSYRVTDIDVRILRIRHTSKNPKEY